MLLKFYKLILLWVKKVVKLGGKIMSRRGENIRKRKDGRWEGRYYEWEPKSGKSKIRSVYARSYGEVKEKLAVVKVSAEGIQKKKDFATEERSYLKRSPNLEETLFPSELLDAEVLFPVVAEEWLAMIERTKKYATYIKYHFIYKKYMQEKLNAFSFSSFEETAFAEIFQNEEKEILSDSLKKSISCVLNQILSYAASHYHTKLFRYSYQKQNTEKKWIEVFNQIEQTKLLQYLYTEMDIYKVGIILCISTGLRLGEICALKWEDIDRKGKVFYVRTTVQRIVAEGYNTKTILLEGEPKSIFSKREIPLSDEMIDLLFSYGNCNKKYVLNKDKPMEPRTYQNKFQRYLQMAGIEKKNFHILRHTFATNCINSGMDIKSISEILGHSDIKTTLNCYMHPTMEMKRQQMNSLSVIYGQYVGQTY